MGHGKQLEADRMSVRTEIGGTSWAVISSEERSDEGKEEEDVSMMPGSFIEGIGEHRRSRAPTACLTLT